MSDFQPILFFVGRDDWQHEHRLNLLLLDKLDRQQYLIYWEDPAASLIYRYKKIERRYLEWLPQRAKRLNIRLLQIGYSLCHPSYVRFLQQRKSEQLHHRRDILRQRIQQIRQTHCGPIIVLAKSSGGRVSSQVADELGLSQLICIGYPFEKPGSGDEPDRYQHLQQIQARTLIIQGCTDPYGGQQVEHKYRLSPQIELFFIDTDHDFQISAAQSQQILNKINQTLALYQVPDNRPVKLKAAHSG